MKAGHSLVRADLLVADPPVLDVEGGRVCGHHVVEQRTYQGELEALSGEEVRQEDTKDGADVPASNDGLK